MRHNSPLIKFLETIANMLIVSFFWIICSIPIVTIIPSSVALYHTTTKIIFNGHGQKVLKDFFNCFKDNILIGTKVNLIYLIATFFVIVGDYAAIQIYKWNIFGLLYLILAIIVTLVYLVSLIYIPAVISKFYLKVIDTFRLSIYFGFQNIFVSILNIVLLIFFVLVAGFIPLSILIIPALYVDLVRIGIEKKMNKFIEKNVLQERVKVIENNIKQDDISFADVDSSISKRKIK